MKTLVGGPEDFEHKKPQNKFEKAKPGSDYKKLPESGTFPHNPPKVGRAPTSWSQGGNYSKTSQFHQSVNSAKNLYPKKEY
jgi:hypothetical protein